MKLPKHRCHRCRADPQPEFYGEPRKCAFSADGLWDEENWSCATVDVLRDAAYAAEMSFRNEDESVAVVMAPFSVADDGPTHVVLTFYKDRGRTARAYSVGHDNLLIPLCWDVADRVASALEASK